MFVAGGIGRGEAIVSYLQMGAAGCQLGTRFVCASESIAHPDFKQAFIRASARDAVVSVQIDPDLPVIPVRALANGGTQRFIDYPARGGGALSDAATSARRQAQLEIELFWAGALRRAVHRRRRRERLADGRPERRHGDPRAADARNHRRAGRPGGGGARRAAAAGGRSSAMQYGQTVLVLRRLLARIRDVMAGEGQRRRPGSPGSSRSSPRTWRPRSARSTSGAPATCSSCSRPKA